MGEMAKMVSKSEWHYSTFAWMSVFRSGKVVAAAFKTAMSSFKSSPRAKTGSSFSRRSTSAEEPRIGKKCTNLIINNRFY